MHVTQGGAVELARRVIVRGFAEPTGAGGEWRELAAGAQSGLRSGDHVRVLGAHFICELPTSREEQLQQQPRPQQQRQQQPPPQPALDGEPATQEAVATQLASLL